MTGGLQCTAQVPEFREQFDGEHLAQIGHARCAATAAFETELNARSKGLFGHLRLASKRDVWPIIAQIAARFSAPRIALIAEAAHVVPPIGAQGLNMSLTDIRTLRDLARDAPQNLGAPDMLTQYHRVRYTDVLARVSGIAALNRISMTSLPALQHLRGFGIGLLHDVAPLRRLAMRAGLG